MPKFEVTLSRDATFLVTVEIEAADEDAAEAQADAMSDDELNELGWRFYGMGEVFETEVEPVEDDEDAPAA